MFASGIILSEDMGANLPIIEVDAEARRRLEAGHPWVRDSAVRRVSGGPPPGAMVRVLSGGRRMGEGLFSPASRIRVRLVTGPAESPLEHENALMAELGVRIRSAASMRERIGFTGAFRVVFGESDGVPGLVADLYNRTLVIQLLSAGMDARRDALVEILREVFSPETVVERSDTGNREREGLKPFRGILFGVLPTGGQVPFEAEGLLMQADPLEGQKTGFYLDQRDNWAALRPLGRGRRVLDACCYSGAFGLSLLLGGAEALTAVDSSRRALSVAEDAAGRNGLSGRARFIAGDAGAVMTEMAGRGEKFGLVVLDPPALARTKAHRVLASRAVRAMNASAISVVEPGGLLFTCSCTPWITADDLAETVAVAGTRLGRRTSILEVRGQSRDHPIHPLMPETRYLSGLLVHVS